MHASVGPCFCPFNKIKKIEISYIDSTSKITDPSELSSHYLEGSLLMWIMPLHLHVKAWSHRRTDMYQKENGLKYAEFGYPVTKFISSTAQSSRDRYVEPGS